MTSQLTAFEYLAERSAATPGLWNRVFSQLSDNIGAVNQSVGGLSGDTITASGQTIHLQTHLDVAGQVHAQGLSLGSTPPSQVTTAAITVAVNSASSDYLYLTDSSGARSSYVIGSRAGGTADGLNIWDASGSTLLASFSKQSIRFFQNVVGPVFDVGGALASTYNAGTFGVGSDSVESRIQAAINQASTDGFQRVYLPASMLSFSASSVSFIASVQMVREGGDWSVYDVSAYGIKGDGTNESAAIQSLESVRPANSTIRFLSGRTYSLGASLATQLFRTVVPGIIDFRGAKLRYTGAVNPLGTGSDGASLGVVNILHGGVVLTGGTIDGNAAARYPIAIKHSVSGVRIDSSIISSYETGGIWPGIAYQCSQDITGTVVTGSRASNIAGIISRPSCPIVNNAEVITGHADITAVLLGGPSSVDNATGCALVLNNAQFNVWLYTLGRVGIRSAPNTLEDNVPLMDFVAHDIGSNTLETSGGALSGTSVYGLESGATIGHIIRVGAHSSWYDYNVISTSTQQPNVDITAGSVQSDGRVRVRGVYRGADGSAIAPHLGFLSEASLGLYRSGSSHLAQSYGTLVLSGLSVGGIVQWNGPAILTGSPGGAGGGVRYISAAGTATDWYHNIPTGGTFHWAINEGEVLRIETGPAIRPGSAGGTSLGTSATPFGDSFLSRVLTASGSAINPAYALSSEKSLGFYRSGNSTVAVSYGTLDLTASGAVTSVASLTIKSGANNSCGTAVLGSNGSVNVANTYVKTGDLVLLTDQTAGGTLGVISLGGIRNSSGFTVLSSNVADTSTVAWLIVRPG